VQPAVDGMFSVALYDNDGWVACGATEVATVSVALQPFYGERAELVLRVDGSDTLGEWFTDDLLDAYAPMWLCERGEAAEVAKYGGGSGVDVFVCG
jgi:hypothetical protein